MRLPIRTISRAERRATALADMRRPTGATGLAASRGWKMDDAALVWC